MSFKKIDIQKVHVAITDYTIKRLKKQANTNNFNLMSLSNTNDEMLPALEYILTQQTSFRIKKNQGR